MIKLKEEIQETVSLDQTQPPTHSPKLYRYEPKETADIFSSLPNTFPIDREASTVSALYEPSDGPIYGTTRFLYESLLSNRDSLEVDSFPMTSPDVPPDALHLPARTSSIHPLRFSSNDQTLRDPQEQSEETGTLFSRFDTLPSQNTITESYFPSSALQNKFGEKSNRVEVKQTTSTAKRRCIVSDTSPDLPPESQESCQNNLNVERTDEVMDDDSDAPPIPPPVDYKISHKKLLNERFEPSKQNERTHVDVSSIHLPSILTLKQEHDLLSSVWKVLSK